MAISLDEAFVNVVECEKDADSSATSNFVDEGDIPTNSTPNQLNSPEGTENDELGSDGA